MANPLKSIEISHIPELVKIAEEVYTSGESKVLRRHRKDLVVLKPLRSSTTRIRRAKSFTPSDPLWSIVGIGRSGLTDISENKHRYLAQAYSLKT